MRRARRVGLAVSLGLVAAAALPTLASAACTLPGSSQPGFTNQVAISDTIAAANQGSYLQIPVSVPAGTTAIHIRYCYDSGSTLDLGAYEPLHAGSSIPGPAERRGWSGSAVKDLAIAVNGFSSPTVYESARKAFVYGNTTRAYQPGPIPAGAWTVELGLAQLGAPSVAYQMDVETSSSTDWSNAPYSAVTQSGAAANPSAGWYAGDVHAHGEQEPGNALVSTSLDYAFKPLAQGGAGLDWIGLVDHNNDVSRGEIGKYEANYPGKLVIPGTEVTTYHGHYNSIGSSAFPDFRGGPVITYPSLAQVAPTTLPASQFATLQAGGGWTQVNHPTIFPGAPAACRGCPWDWADAETDYSKVDAIELQTGPADLGTTQNPFTKTAIEFYEARLAAGFHIAAVGSSDSHQADETDIATAPIGRASTVAYATELSKPAIVQAIRDDHTYVKFYGNDGPDIRVTAHSPGAPDAIIGDTLAGPQLDLEVEVLRAGPGATRPGNYDLELVKNGTVADKVAIAGDDFTHTFTASEAARYSVEVIREAPDADRYEVYSSPVWFERAETLKLGKLKLNKKKGTAKLTVTVAHPGKLKLKGKSLKKAKKTVTTPGKVKLTVKPKGKLARKLRDNGKAKVKAKVTFTPDGGEAAVDSKKLKLKRR